MLCILGGVDPALVHISVGLQKNCGSVTAVAAAWVAVAAQIAVADPWVAVADPWVAVAAQIAVAVPWVAVADPWVAVAAPWVAVAAPWVAVADPWVAVAAPWVAVADPLLHKRWNVRDWMQSMPSTCRLVKCNDSSSYCAAAAMRATSANNKDDVPTQSRKYNNKDGPLEKLWGSM